MENQELAMDSETLSFLHESRKTHLIGGLWADSKNDRTSEVFDPSTGQVITTIPLGGHSEVDDAVRAAQAAFPAWSGKSPMERSVLLHRWADAIEQNQHLLAQIEALDVGKALINAEGFDIPFGVACVRYYADLALQAQYDIPLTVQNSPNSTVSSAGFGTITSAADPRIGQLALKLIF